MNVLVDHVSRGGNTLTIRVRQPLDAGYWVCIACKGSGERRYCQHIGGDLWGAGIALYRSYSTACPRCHGDAYGYDLALVMPAQLAQQAHAARHYNPSEARLSAGTCLGI